MEIFDFASSKSNGFGYSVDEIVNSTEYTSHSYRQSNQIHGEAGTTPILRWAGSKKKLLQHLVAASPAKFNTYLEPFVGSGVLYLRLNPKRAILSDINEHLIQAYETVREEPKLVWDCLMAWSATSEFYYHLREKQSVQLNSFERAARFIYLNRYCFNGVYRTNLKGEFNVSRGKGNLGIPDWEIFSAFAEKLTFSKIENCDFEKTVNRAKKNDYIYLDPPYAEVGKRNRGEYGIGTFRPSDVSRLLESILRADRRGAKVLLSYSADHLDLKLLKGWNIYELTVMRNVSGFTGSRRNADEILVSNYKWDKAHEL